MLKNKIINLIILTIGTALLIIFAFGIFQLLFFILIIGAALYFIMKIPVVRNWVFGKIRNRFSKQFNQGDSDFKNFMRENNETEETSKVENSSASFDNIDQSQNIKDITKDSKIINS
jgi:ABC-type transport system involved in cytochrome bd biosynthesis fused ATPase/permease subunit